MEDNINASELFHKLWGKATNSYNYDKKEWQQLYEIFQKGQKAIKELERLK